MAKKKKRVRRRGPRRVFVGILAVLVIGAVSYGLLAGATFVMKALRPEIGSPVVLGGDMEMDPMEAERAEPSVSTGAEEGRLKGVTICLDPGHGFSNGGTVAPEEFGVDVVEQYITLDVSLKLRDLLLEQGAEVVMTRDSDFEKGKTATEYKSISLDRRCEIGNACRPDLFLSIHCDSFEDDPSVNGAKFYYYDAPDRDETELERLIGSMQLGVGALTGSEVDREIQKGVSAFQVVRKVNYPSTLLEMGFVTNREDAANMADDAWRAKLAQGLYDGIVGYFDPPEEIVPEEIVPEETPEEPAPEEAPPAEQ